MLHSSLIELVPRCSLTPATARIFIAVVAATTLAVATSFALRGMWPVLLFAGLEIGVLAWAVRASMRAGSKRETIAVDEQSITIRRIDPAGEDFLVFPRHGSAVKLHAPSTALRLRSGKVSHGRRAPQPRRSSQTTGGEYERTVRALTTTRAWRGIAAV